MRVIAFDNRGAGKSSRPDYPYSMDMFVEDTKNLLDHLKIQKGIHLCGFSLGGMIAQAFTLKYPHMVKTLILLATNAYVEPTKYSQTHQFYKQFEQMNFEEKLQLVIPLIYTNSFKRKLKRDKNLYEKIKNDMNLIVYSEDSPRSNDYINQWKALENYDLRDSLDQINVPTLIAVGENDLNSSPKKSKKLHENIPNSNLNILENVKHGFIIEAQEKVNALIWNFLKKHLG